MFSDKVVLVTGAASGIGRASAERFAGAGARVVAIDRDRAGVEETAARIHEQGGRAETVVADVTDAAQVQAFVRDAVARHARIDAFHCNAGVQGAVAPITTYDAHEFDRVIAINLKSAFLCMRYVLPVMMRQRSGAVVVTCSIASLGGLPNLPAYVASKHAALGLVRSAAIDVAPFGVRVNAVCPGAVETPLLSAIYASVNPENPAAVAARFAASVPTGRLIDAGEVADIVLYLCSDQARNIVGTHFVVDGGRSALLGGATQSR